MKFWQKPCRVQCQNFISALLRKCKLLLEQNEGCQKSNMKGEKMTNSNTTKRVYEPKSWMKDNIKALQFMKLRELCIPGAHDAGMSVRGTGTAGAFECNVVTQKNSILGQLNLGVRYFDIRPVISSGKYYTGHYSDVPVAGWQGANGQSIDSIVSEINQFTNTQRELVILYLSHDLDTDSGRSYQQFTQEQYDGLCTKLEGINGRASSDYPTFLDLSLGELIGGDANQSLVIVIADPSRSGVVAKAGSGIWDKSKLEVYDKYSDTNDLNKMIDDQLTKMKGGHGYFLLSWTLTQSPIQATTCELPFGGSSILELAGIANAALRGHLMPAITSTVYPNIIYLDGIDNTDAMKISVDINYMALDK
ncbi:MAG: hypothetical protein GY749_24230 [Desulfobacteraceae bacterium]|nr:hypothetical protein [Desulfobacteraceae bacterium]